MTFFVMELQKLISTGHGKYVDKIRITTANIGHLLPIVKKAIFLNKNYVNKN